ncbi:Universal stress protein A-like protein [Linum perenne]
MNALSWCLNNLVSNVVPPTVVLLYVKPPPPVYPSFTAADSSYWNTIVDDIYLLCFTKRLDLDSVIRSVYDRFDLQVRLERAIGSGEPKDVICKTVNQLEADTLVMGCHGYGFIKRALLGSVSDYCAKNVKCPVVIVKRQEQ